MMRTHVVPCRWSTPDHVPDRVHDHDHDHDPDHDNDPDNDPDRDRDRDRDRDHDRVHDRVPNNDPDHDVRAVAADIMTAFTWCTTIGGMGFVRVGACRCRLVGWVPSSGRVCG
jgi:hypothetical protein